MCVVAREVTERLIDDLDGGAAVETVRFAFDGATYEIDLSKRNAGAFRKTLERYVRASRRSTTSPRRARAVSTGRRRTATATTSSKPKRNFDIVQLREWASANEVAVPSRGRIPQAVVAQYKAAGGR